MSHKSTKATVNADTNAWCYLIEQFRRAFEAYNALPSSMRSSLAIKSEKYPKCCFRSSENHAHTLHPARRSFCYTAAGGLLAVAKARCTLLAII